jgi:acetyl-CoA acetyltransferase/uncharacterized OB-fold protein
VPEPLSRPLPPVTPETEFFWSSGADGQLRFQECLNCSALIHPPQPVCRHCRSQKVGVRIVSGQATLAGFTVNHRFSIPGKPSPYVIAQVAIVEDPRVRMTTNIVADCDPEQLELGQLLEVEFEHTDDENIWLPVFRPAAEQPASAPQAPDEIPLDRIGEYVRPMVSQDKFEDKVALTGIGMSQIGRRLMRPPLSLTVEACEAAVADAGLTLDDIDGLSTYPGMGGFGGFSEGGVTGLASALGLRPTWFNGAMETFGPSGPLVAAMFAVASGFARHVLCYRTLWESTHTELMRQDKVAPLVRDDPLRPYGTEAQQWFIPFGLVSAANTIAQNAQRYFHRYGTNREETLGWIALNQRANAALHPTAIYRTPLTMEDYLEARMVTTPLGLYDCDVPCDGAVAIIVSHVDTARDLAKPPVLVEAVGTQLIERLEWDQSTLTHEPLTFGQAAHMWSRTSLRPKDVDVAELYDGFTLNCLSWIEALGFCGIGEGKDFLAGGHNIARDGVLPLNTHGGQLSHGRTHGMGLVHEAVTQLRGEAGERQIPGAQVGVVSCGGVTPSIAMLLRADT